MSKKKEDGLFSIEKRQISISDDVAFVEHLVSVADLLEAGIGNVRFTLDSFRKEFGRGLSDSDILAMMDSIGVPIVRIGTKSRGFVPCIEHSALRAWLADRKEVSHG